MLQRYFSSEFLPTGDRMLQLALMFEVGGLGIAPDLHDAFQCHVFAKELGQVTSRGIMGEYYERGLVVKTNSRKARACYSAAAKAGDARAQYNLARIHYHAALGVKQPDKHAARILWEKAAMKHHVPSIFALGYCHENGLGGLKIDTTEAKKHYTLAAKHGSCTRSAFNLGRLYESGRLLQDDDALRLKCARFWYERALALGYAKAAERLECLSSPQEKITPAAVPAEP